MHSVETTGRDALAEMRRMLGVLRNNNPSEAAATRGRAGAQPSLAELDSTIAHCTQAGTPTELIISGNEERPLPPESNSPRSGSCKKRSPTSSSTAVPPPTPPSSCATAPTPSTSPSTTPAAVPCSRLAHTGAAMASSGSATLVEIYNGRLAAGPRPGGGYRVDASLPINAATDRAGGGLRRTRKLAQV